MMFINKVSFWNDLTEKEDREVNIVYGETFQHALEEVLNYYGEDSISSVTFEPIGDDTNDKLIQINDNVSKFIIRENN